MEIDGPWSRLVAFGTCQWRPSLSQPQAGEIDIAPFIWGLTLSFIRSFPGLGCSASEVWYRRLGAAARVPGAAHSRQRRLTTETPWLRRLAKANPMTGRPAAAVCALALTSLSLSISASTAQHIFMLLGPYKPIACAGILAVTGQSE